MMNYSYDKRAAANTNLTSEDFKKEVERSLNVKDRYVIVQLEKLRASDSILITLYNIPKEDMAEKSNNRLLLSIHYGKGPQDKIKVQVLDTQPQFGRFSAKTGHPAKIAKYIADYINGIIKDVPPTYANR